MNRIILALLVASLMYAGCRKKETQTSTTGCDTIIINCEEKTSYLAFHWEFKPNELDTMVIRSFKYDDGFKTLTEENIYTGAEINSGDANHHFADIRIENQYDYTIELPGINRTFFIHPGLIQDKTDTLICPRHGPPHEYCFSWPPYYVIDGDTVTSYTKGPYNFFLLLLK
jgi:hypothetical protein